MLLMFSALAHQLKCVIMCIILYAENEKNADVQVEMNLIGSIKMWSQRWCDEGRRDDNKNDD